MVRTVRAVRLVGSGCSAALRATCDLCKSMIRTFCTLLVICYQSAYHVFEFEAGTGTRGHFRAGFVVCRLAPEHAEKLRDILAALDRSRGTEGMNLPGFRLHALKGPLSGHYAVSVSGNWRVTFRFEEGAAVDVNYLDYH